MTNMEGSGETNSVDDTALSKKNRRIKVLKTRSQLEVLETFYDGHKYPSEFIKLHVAEKTGLTEKQVSSWFCYRRLKDRRVLNEEIYANERQGRSSGGLQDSCESTKQDEIKTLDPTEVQSSRFNSQHLSAAGLMVEHGTNHAGNFSRIDDTSSRRSSSRNLYSKVKQVHMTASKLSSQNVGNFVNAGKPRSGPSGYLKVRPRLENPVVTDIKTQLGPHYRDDGPPLGIEFDPLPPLAFEPATQQPDNSRSSSETYSAEERVVGLSPFAQSVHQECISKPHYIEEDNILPSEDGSKFHKKRISVAGYGSKPNMSFPETVLDGKKSKQTESLFFQKPKQEFPLSEYSSANMHEFSAPNMAIYDRRNSYESRTMRSAGSSLRGTPAGHHQLQPYRGGINQDQEEAWLKSSNGRMPKAEQRDSFNSSYPDYKVGNFNGAKGEIDDVVVTDRPKIVKIPRKLIFKNEYPPHVRKV